MISPIQKPDRPAEMIGQMPSGKLVAKGNGGLSHEFRADRLFLHGLTQPSRERFLLTQEESALEFIQRPQHEPDLNAGPIKRLRKRRIRASRCRCLGSSPFAGSETPGG